MFSPTFKTKKKKKKKLQSWKPLWQAKAEVRQLNPVYKYY